MRKPSPFAVGITTFCVCWITLSVLWPMACADGWLSPSLGRMGACSWHGGVSLLSRFSQYIVIPVSLGLAFVSRIIAARFMKKKGSVGTVPQIFDVGAHVYHPRFGPGKIVHMEGDGCDTKLLISFSGSHKKLHLNTAIASGLKVTGP